MHDPFVYFPFQDQSKSCKVLEKAHFFKFGSEIENYFQHFRYLNNSTFWEEIQHMTQCMHYPISTHSAVSNGNLNVKYKQMSTNWFPVLSNYYLRYYYTFSVNMPLAPKSPTQMSVDIIISNKFWCFDTTRQFSDHP